MSIFYHFRKIPSVPLTAPKSKLRSKRGRTYARQIRADPAGAGQRASLPWDRRSHGDTKLFLDLLSDVVVFSNLPPPTGYSSLPLPVPPTSPRPIPGPAGGGISSRQGSSTDLWDATDRKDGLCAIGAVGYPGYFHENLKTGPVAYPKYL